MSRVPTALCVLALGLIAASIVRADASSPNWLRKGAGTPTGRSAPAMAYDAARGETVLFGGIADLQYHLADTWRWDGSAWTRSSASDSDYPPYARNFAAMAYDSARGRVVLFGGHDGTHALNDTWEWDGSTWTQRRPATSPPARSRHAMAYDSARGRVVLFGGNFGPGISDTWEWDGTNWVQRTPATNPPARYGAAMAYDSARGRTVLFGGWGNEYLSDTWEWDGNDWVQRSPSAAPPARFYHAMAYDIARNRVVLFGGSTSTNGVNPMSDTWEWDGNAWLQRAPAVSPPARSTHVMAYDPARGRVVLFGGSGGGFRSDTWEWDGNAWIDRASASSPPGRTHHALAYDSARARVVLFGGLGGGVFSDTWEFDGLAWVKRASVVSPPARYGHAMVYDSARGRVVLFGGRDASGVMLADTWEWDGNDWIQRSPAISPPARYTHAMAYDSMRGRTLLFGGSSDVYFADTWEWDGNAWNQRAPTTSPTPREGAAIAYDAARDRVVLFGGYGGAATNPILKDTWEWDGSTWAQRTPVIFPDNPNFHAMVYDSARALVILVEGYSSPSYSDLWEWDGNTWARRATATTLPPRTYHAMAYDAARGRVVLFGGLLGGARSDTWEYAVLAGCAFAQSVIDFAPGTGGSTSAANALGPSDEQSVTLGIDGSLTVRMEKTIADGPGTDLYVYENGTSVQDYNEDFRVDMSEDGVNFKFVRECRGECQVDLLEARLTRASYVRVAVSYPTWPPSVKIDAAAALSCDGPVEICNGLDDRGDGVVPPGEIDHDGDGFVACTPWEGTSPSILGGGDCDDAQAAVSPGAQETCNGLDDDCDLSIDEDIGAPYGVVTLTEARSGTDAILSWDAVQYAAAYDIVKGDLSALRSTGGVFEDSTWACFDNDQAALSTQDTEVLAPGEARWHLVRAVACGANGTYDDWSASQIANRDVGIFGSGWACP